MNICCIIVLYEPNVILLKRNLDVLRKQLNSIILVDNSQTSLNEILNDIINENVNYIFLGGNLGIAKAQNLGIAHAKSLNFDFVLLLDQDSIPSINLVNSLCSDYSELINNGIDLAVLGSNAINSFTKEPFKPRLRKFKSFSFNENIILASQVISSGSLISIKDFYLVGEFKEELFIDGVDHEWCWRAISKGKKCAISKKSLIEHSLGEGDKFFLGIRISISSSFRIYYQYRNFIYLSKLGYVPIYWKVVNLLKYIVKFFYYPTLISPKYLPRILKGINDGINM